MSALNKTAFSMVGLSKTRIYGLNADALTNGKIKTGLLLFLSSMIYQACY